MRKQLKQWQREFRAQHGREPSKSDVLQNPEIASTYDTWRALSAATTTARPPSKASTSASPADASMRAPPTTPQKRQKTIPMSTSDNPFRSPKKPTPSYVKSPSFPSKVVQETPYDSDMSDDEPASLTVPQQRTPSKSQPPPVFAAFTPRTKARKRLRGEDVRTPPRPGLQRTESQVRSALLAHSPQAKRRIFSAPQASLDSIPPADDEILGPSPRKPKTNERNFRPLFRTASAQDTHLLRTPEKSPAQPSVSSQNSHATLSPTPATSQTSATTQVPPIAPGAQTLELDDDEDEARTVHVLPYQRYGSARRTVHDEWDEMDALEFPSTRHSTGQAEPSSPLTMDNLSLVSPAHHTARADAARRQRNEELTHALFHEETHIPAPIHARADVDPDETLRATGSDDDWASEASEGEYGLGDGEMDSDDIL